MKVPSAWRGDKLCFKHFIVQKDSETFYGVYRCLMFDNRPYGNVITSAKTMKAAARKAKLLEIGYCEGRDDAQIEF